MPYADAEAQRAYNRAYLDKNRERIRERQRAAETRRREDPAYRERARQRDAAWRLDRGNAMARAHRNADPEASRAHEQKYRDSNRELIRAKSAEYYRTHPEEYAEYGRLRRLRRFGLSDEDYEALFSRQDGRCAICQVAFIKTPHIDHNHATGSVRGLLCGPCNQGVGQFDDSPERLAAAIRYLEATS